MELKNKIRKAIREQIKKLKEDYKPSHRAYDVIDKSKNDEIVFKKLSYEAALEKAHKNPNYKIIATQRLAENEPPYFANQKYYDLLNDLRDEGHLHRYGVTQLQMQFGLKEKEAQEIYNQYKEDLEAEQPDASDFYLKDLNEAATELGYVNEYVVGGKGHAHVFKTDEDQDKLFDFVRQYVSEPEDAEKITMQFLGDDKARMPDVDEPGFRKAFFDFMNYEIIGWPKFISGDLDNATIEYKGKTYTNISFEQEDREPRDYAGHITLPIYSYASNKTEDGVQFNVNVTQDGGGSVEEVEWDELEAFTPYRK